ncbi:putative protein TPRXL [Oryzias melastigma]|uniref:putative protein TPRXL n=1 Tax=Oryzias melastigma TaxID=30732 RepID=UPI000CF7BAB8|nr:putative protein TPRXL [Oryzias melastigma]
MERASIFVLCVCLGVLLLDHTEATNTTTGSYSNVTDTTESANDTQPSGTAGSTETTPLVNHSTGPTTSGFHSTQDPPPGSSVFPSGYPQTNAPTSEPTGTSTVGQDASTSTPPAASTPPGSSSCTPGGCGPLLLCAVCMLLLSCMD